ncbi:ATP-binding protein, partial [Bradyrhizobium sp. 177]|uniref:ATP-binding protein n=1 Tax=Bradyrhizobium sp. 177 TaxID=2782647 RepID=UPI001FF91430
GTNRPDIRSKPTKSFKMSKSACHQRPSTYDDWGLAPITGEQRRDLLEVVDDRHQRGSTIITSQVPIENWHEIIADPTIADAVLDRLVHNAHRLILKGDSMRKITAQRANLDAAKKT